MWMLPPTLDELLPLDHPARFVAEFVDALLLSERRQFLDSADTIATFAAEMSEFLKTSELTETRALVHSFVKEVEVKPGKAAIVYSIPTPEDSPIGGADAAEVALNGRVRS